MNLTQRLAVNIYFCRTMSSVHGSDCLVRRYWFKSTPRLFSCIIYSSCSLLWFDWIAVRDEKICKHLDLALSPEMSTDFLGFGQSHVQSRQDLLGWSTQNTAVEQQLKMSDDPQLSSMQTMKSTGIVEDQLVICSEHRRVHINLSSHDSGCCYKNMKYVGLKGVGICQKRRWSIHMVKFLII